MRQNQWTMNDAVNNTMHERHMTSCIHQSRNKLCTQNHINYANKVENTHGQTQAKLIYIWTWWRHKWKRDSSFLSNLQQDYTIQLKNKMHQQTAQSISRKSSLLWTCNTAHASQYNIKNNVTNKWTGTSRLYINRLDSTHTKNNLAGTLWSVLMWLDHYKVLTIWQLSASGYITTSK